MRVLLADDNQEFAHELGALLSSDFDVVGTVSDGQSLLDAAAVLGAKVVITDLEMPRMNGIRAGRQLLDRKLCSAVIILSVHTSQQFVEEALKSGIRGYVAKEHAGEDLIAAVHDVLEGRTFVSMSCTPKTLR